MATVYGIVKQHKGYIACTSRLGQGTSFQIYLAHDRSASARPAAKPRGSGEDSPSAPRGATVLVVEDEPRIRELMVQALQLGGYHAASAATPQEALAVATQMAHPINLLLTDVVMPGGSGPGLARQLRKIHPGLRVLFTSGYSPQSVNLSDFPGARFLQKPFGLDEMLQAVTALLAD